MMGRVICRVYSLSLLLFFIVAAGIFAGCGDDSAANKTRDCQAGMELNPITGNCQRAQREPPPPSPDPQPTPRPDAGASDTTQDEDTGPGAPDTTDPQDCRSGERRCVGDAIETCRDGQFTHLETCEEGFECSRGNCIPGEGTCHPGSPRCIDDSSYQFCASDGLSYGEAIDCPSGSTCVNGRCSTGCDGLSEKSNMGCQYLTLRLNQAAGDRVLAHSVVVSNPGEHPATVRVASPGIDGLNIPDQVIQPQQSAIIDFPTNNMVSAPGISDKLYLLNTDQPVIATQFAPLNNPGAGSESSDASLLLPTNALGTQYIVLNWPGPGGGVSFPPLPGGLGDPGTYLDVIAIEDNTTVQVSSPRALKGGSMGDVSANSSRAYSLDRYQILHLGISGNSDTDISGATINSDKPVAVFVGATIVNIPDRPIRENPPAGCTQNNRACTLNDDCCSGICGRASIGSGFNCLDTLPAGDHLEQQLFPTEAWGTSYIATPFYSRGDNDFSVFKVTAANDNTEVTLDPPINGVSTFTLNRGEVREFYSADAFEIKGEDLIMAAQFMIGGSITSSGDGDPAFLLPPAVQQFRDNYVFLVPDQYAKNFVTLIAPTGTDVELDGSTHAAASFTELAGDSGWSYKLIDSLLGGVHTASADEAFGIVVHGMDRYISYAFAGGIILPN